MLDKSKRILEFIREFIPSRGYAPTVIEIQRGCGISSKSVVNYHLKALEDEGHIKRDAYIARSIRLIGLGHGIWPVPILGAIEADEPIPVAGQDNCLQGMVEVPTNLMQGKKNLYAIRVKETSMIDILVDDGDIVIMEPVDAVQDGQMVAAWLIDREKATLKRIYHEQERIRLEPANQTMKPIYVDPDKIQVQGKVIAVLRKIG